MQATPLLPVRTARHLKQGWQIHVPALSIHKPLKSPCVWEDAGLPISLEGPVDYLLEFDLTPALGRRYWLHFGGVSYQAEGWLNEQPIGFHRGIWDAFGWELTSALRPGANRLRLRVIKNGGEQFPVPQVLSGFLPYVSSTFGGIWQPVHLFDTGSAWLSDLYVRGEADGTVRIEATLCGEGTPTLILQIFAPNNRPIYQTRWQGVGVFQHEVKLPKIKPWSPRSPALYHCRAEVYLDGELSHQVEQPFGFRTLEVEGSRILLNGRPFYPRGLLHWGWYLRTHAPAPSQEEARQELHHLQAMGFNMLKACLWVPSRDYLTLCDQLGVAVWLELPLWLPRMDAAQIEQVRREYEAIVRQVRSHPSILIWTLGCELSKQFPHEVLGELYQMVKQLTGSPLVRDNSGGGECYGGALQEYADFADYHLYTDLPFARLTFTAFLERIRPSVPWLQGEFCDHDTMRDFIGLRREVEARHLWWLERDPAVNPQGVRWFYDTPFVEERLHQQGLKPHQFEMVISSRQEQIFHHKFTLELMRALPGTSGYIVTGLKDTPITTSGLLDERGEPKLLFLADYRAFNDDTVLLLDWHRRRVWLAGGDRPANPDPFNHFGGQTLYPTLAVSHFGDPLRNAELRWQVNYQSGVHRSGKMEFPQITGGQLEPLGMLQISAPPVDKYPCLMKLMAWLTVEGKNVAYNYWHLWLYPQPDWSKIGKWSLYDPDESLIGLPARNEVFIPLSRGQSPSHPRLLATRWEEWMRDFIRQGGRILLILTDGASLVQTKVPFWREATHLFCPHALDPWVLLPTYADERVYGLSTDRALLGEESRQAIDPEAVWQPLWRRFDTRTGWVSHYLAEVLLGKGGMLVTTLHFAGELGDTPLSLQYHPAGQYWLWGMCRYLRDTKYRRNSSVASRAAGEPESR
jgi:hypothetical protein